MDQFKNIFRRKTLNIPSIELLDGDDVLLVFVFNETELF